MKFSLGETMHFLFPCPFSTKSCSGVSQECCCGTSLAFCQLNDNCFLSLWALSSMHPSSSLMPWIEDLSFLWGLCNNPKGLFCHHMYVITNWKLFCFLKHFLLCEITICSYHPCNENVQMHPSAHFKLFFYDFLFVSLHTFGINGMKKH